MYEPGVIKHLKSCPQKKVVLYGLETHVCVRQTCFDLLQHDYEVHVVVDAVSSMQYHDRFVGIEAMRDAGAHLTTFQSVVMELMKSSTHEKFKDVLKIVKAMPEEHIDYHHKL
mmetsp:Transcript_34811/g.25982  ORF Transcript_34811/g.25982 Transcript_34811/m.25982 type:complete len:113 (-) Transcript_34811:28-366(-)